MWLRSTVLEEGEVVMFLIKIRSIIGDTVCATTSNEEFAYELAWSMRECYGVKAFVVAG
jgi:hypothetical protein